MAIQSGCEGCYFYQAIQEASADDALTEQVYHAEAPDATPEQIKEAQASYKQIAEGALEALPDCPGYNHRRTIALYFLGKYFGDKGDSTHILKRQCNNPFINSEAFSDLERAASPSTLQTEALKSKGEYVERKLDLTPWPPSKVIRDYRDAYKRFGPAHKMVSWLLPSIVVMSGLSIVAQEFSSNKERTTPTPPEQLVNKYTAGTYDKSQRQAFDAVTTLTPAAVRAAHTLKAKIALGQSIQWNVFKVSQVSFARGLDNRQAADEYDVARDLLPQATQIELQRYGFDLLPVPPVACNISGEYDPLDYSNHPPKDFEVEAKNTNGREIVQIPLGAKQEPYYSDNSTNTGSSKPCSEYPRIHYPPNPDYLKIVY